MDEIQKDDENENHMIKIMDSCKMHKQAEESNEPGTSDSLHCQTGVPKPVETIISMPVASLDVHDCEVETTDKLVQANNEGDDEINVEIIVANLELKLNLHYCEDQWSPFNKDGKKVYDRDFLLALRKAPKSNEKPENLVPDVMANENREAVPKCKNKQGKTDKKKVSMKDVKLQETENELGLANITEEIKSEEMQEKENVKLHECEYPWRPARFTSYTNMTEDEVKTVKLYKKFRSVLNKLTPQKFETLLDQARSLSIDTAERLQGVVDLVVEKAVDEPNFSVAYALLCREFALMQVPATDGKRKEGAEFVNFRKLLVTRCQLKFEKNSVDETERNRRTKEIEDCNDPEKKKDMQLELDEYDRRLRQKSVGNIRFIGELFKQQMLTVNIMLRCLNNLLDTKDEESLECLCKLLTTVGKELETKKVDLGGIFSAMKDIADKKHGRISSRVRFIIQDVIDLRSSRWIPRKQDFNPKTMDQIQKEVEHEQLTIQAMNYMPITPGREERGAGGGWLKNKVPMMDEPIGPIQMLRNWGRGCNIKKQPLLIDTAKMYAALENIGTESDKRPALGSQHYNLHHTTPKVESTPEKQNLNQLECRLKRIMRNYVLDICTTEECDKYIQKSISPSELPQIVPVCATDSFLNISRKRRLKIGFLLAHLIKVGTLSLADYCIGLEDVLETANKLKNPNVWNDVANSIFPILCEDSALENFQKVFELLITKEYSPQLLVSLLMLIIEAKEEPFVFTSPVTNSAPSLVDSENLENRSNTLEEYLNGHCTLHNCEQFIKDSISSSAHSQLVSDWYMSVVGKSKTNRMQTGFLFAQLMKGGTLSLQSYCIGLTTVIEEANELIFDIPSVWDDVAELIYPVFCEMALTPEHLHQVFDLFIKKHATKVLSCLFKMFVQSSSNF